MNGKHALAIGLLTSMIAACSSDGDTDRKPGAQAGAQTTGAAAPAPAAATAPAPGACPSDVPEAKRLVTDASARAVQVVGDQVFYQGTTGLLRVGLDGTGPVTVIDSPTLVHTWVEGDVLVTIEGPTDPDASPDAVVRVRSLKALAKAGADGALDLDGTVTPPTTWNAAGTKVFASDATGFFLVGDEQDGQAIYQLTTDNQFVAIAPADGGVVTSLQITPDAVWFVRDNAHVFHVDRQTKANPDDKLALGLPALDADGNPVKAKEAFTIDAAGCGLVVAGSHAICVKPSTIEQRDLTGANPTALLELAKSRAQAPFGVGVGAGDTLVLGSSSAIRTIHVADATEHVVACGRPGINSVDAAEKQVVWSEEGNATGGIWVATR